MGLENRSNCINIIKDPIIKDSLRDLLLWVQENQLCDDRARNILIPGDQKIGTIHHFAQMHAATATSIDNKSEDCSSFEAEARVVSVQGKILQDLMDQKYDAIFMEGVDLIDIHVRFMMSMSRIVFDKKFANDPVYPNVDMRKAIFDYFQKTTVEDVRDRLLYSYGWAIVAASFSMPQTELLGAEDITKNTEIFKELGLEKWCAYVFKQIKLHKSNPIQENLTKSEIGNLHLNREFIAMEKIQRYLTEHPWKKVALVYGGAHNFQSAYVQVFGMKWGPVFVRNSYPQDISISVSLPDNGMAPIGRPSYGENRIQFVDKPD